MIAFGVGLLHITEGLTDNERKQTLSLVNLQINTL